MRTKKAFINVAINCFSYFVSMVTMFFLRKKLNEFLGLEIMGIDAIFSNVVSMLSVVELGLGSSIGYKLHKPIIENKWSKIASILNFIKYFYLVISVVIVLLGVFISFFVVNSLDTKLSNFFLEKILILYILDIISCYLFYHKRIMFMIDQKNYISNIVKIFVTISFFIMRILSITIIKSFTLYILLKIISNLIENMLMSFLFQRYYSNIKLKNAEKITKYEKREIINDIKSLFFHRLGGACITKIPGVVVFLNIPIKENGIYYNYSLIFNSLLGISNEFFNGISASFGNFLNKESKNKIYENFKVLYFLSFLIYSFFSITFLETINSFMKLWMGYQTYLFSMSIICIMSLNLYVLGIKQCIDMVKISAGIFSQDKFCPIMESSLNFIFSYFLSKKIGILGIFLGNILSTIFIPFISQPFFVYKLLFFRKKIEYYRKYLIYLLLTIFYYIICNYLINSLNIFNLNLILQVVVKCFICFIIVLLLNVVLFKNSCEFKRIFVLISDLVGSFV